MAQRAANHKVKNKYNCLQYGSSMAVKIRLAAAQIGKLACVLLRSAPVAQPPPCLGVAFPSFAQHSGFKDFRVLKMYLDVLGGFSSYRIFGCCYHSRIRACLTATPVRYPRSRNLLTLSPMAAPVQAVHSHPLQKDSLAVDQHRSRSLPRPRL